MKNNNQEYAMKVIKKSDIIQYGLVEYTMLEKNVLIRSNNPFVVKLKYSFQTDQKLYLVMELVNGGQLTKLLGKQRDKRFTQIQAQFCAAEIVLGLYCQFNRFFLFLSEIQSIYSHEFQILKIILFFYKGKNYVQKMCKLVRIKYQIDFRNL